MNLPHTCIHCPNLRALQSALLEGQIELTIEKLTELLTDLDGSCSGKCSEVNPAPLISTLETLPQPEGPTEASQDPVA